YFEWPELPIEAPAHRAIDFDDRVSDFRYAISGVAKRARKRLPEKRANPIFGPHERLQSLPRVLDVLGHLERRELHFLRGSVLERCGVKRQNFSLVAFGFFFPIEARRCFISQ